MPKINHLLLAILVVLLALYGVLRMYDMQRKKAFVLLSDVDTGHVEELIITTSRRQTALRKDGDRYLFVSPFAGIAASTGAVHAYLRNLTRLTIQRDLGRREEKDVAPFGVAARSPLVVVKAGGREIPLVLGARDPVAEENYLYDRERRKLYLTGRSAEDLFQALPEDFRDRSLVSVSSGSVVSLAFLAANGRRLSFTRNGGDWYLEGTGLAGEYLCDAGRIRALLDAVTGLRIGDFTPFDERAPVQRSGLSHPRLTLQVGVSSGPARRLEFGAFYGANTYVAVDGELKGGLLSAQLKELEPSATSFIRSFVVDFPPAKIASFTSRDGDGLTYHYERVRGRWYRTGKKKRDFEDEKMEAFLGALTNLTIEKFVFDAPLGAVAKEMDFYDRAGAPLLQLLIGTRSGDRVRVKYKDKRGVFEVPAHLVETLSL